MGDLQTIKLINMHLIRLRCTYKVPLNLNGHITNRIHFTSHLKINLTNPIFYLLIL